MLSYVPIIFKNTLFSRLLWAGGTPFEWWDINIIYTIVKAIFNTCDSCQKQMKTHSIIRVKDVRCGRVIQDEGFVEVSAQAAQILDIAALVENTRFSE